MGPNQLLLFTWDFLFFFSFALVPPSGTIEKLISLDLYLFHPESLNYIAEIFQDILRINLVQQVAAVKIHSG